MEALEAGRESALGRSMRCGRLPRAEAELRYRYELNQARRSCGIFCASGENVEAPRRRRRPAGAPGQ
jgi:hypothetical protein